MVFTLPPEVCELHLVLLVISVVFMVSESRRSLGFISAAFEVG